MKARSVFITLVETAILLTTGISHARWMNPSTGRFMTVDSYEGNDSTPGSLHKYMYCQSNPVDYTDCSGHDIGEALTVISMSGLVLAAITPTTSQARGVATVAISLPQPTSKDAQLLTGLIFAESSTKNYGGGENDAEKDEIGFTVLNRTYYATQTAPNGNNYNKTFGNGSVSTAIEYPNEFAGYQSDQWKKVISGSTLKPKAALEKLQSSELEHLKLSIEAANFCLNGKAPLPTGLARIGDTPGEFPIAFNKAKDKPPSNRMKKFLHVGSHTFYCFKPGRETK